MDLTRDSIQSISDVTDAEMILPAEVVIVGYLLVFWQKGL